jgi:threonine synthase
VEYTSTRNKNERLGFNDVLLTGLSPDGGLYVPAKWPNLTTEKKLLSGLSYSQLAARLMKPFIGDDIEDSALTAITDSAYKEFCSDEIAPMVEIAPSLWLLELFHGPTLSFKDFALQVVSRMFDHVLSQKGEHITVIGATSGDTGSAAIEACKNRRNIDLFMLHPIGRVSEVQRKQMTCVKANNIHNIAIEGTFDDCQGLVKAMFQEPAFRSDLSLAAVNSINWARIMAQVVYYHAASMKLSNETPTFSVPTGNFGNAYAGYAAKRAGLNVKGLLVATNQNDILHRTFTNGIYQRELVKPSISPSMDIQVASNFERYLFELCDRNDILLTQHMLELKKQGKFSIDSDRLEEVKKIFSSTSVGERETLLEMERVYGETGLLIDPHTAIGIAAARTLDNEENGPVVCLATAHPAKFAASVKKATGQQPSTPDRLLSVLAMKEHYDIVECNLSQIQTYIRRRSRRFFNQ